MVDVVIFTSTGRESFVAKTIEQFSKGRVNTLQIRIILSVDGELQAELVASLLSTVDVLIYRKIGRGYYGNIEQALQQVSTEFFLWMEDDWLVGNLKEITFARDLLSKFENLAQVRWPKNSYLLLEDRDAGKVEGAALYSTFYSLNPHLCRTAFALEVLRTIKEGQHAGSNIEVAFSCELRKHRLLGAVLDPLLCRAEHLGGGENCTDRYVAHQIMSDTELKPSDSEYESKGRLTLRLSVLDRLFRRSSTAEMMIKSAFISVGGPLCALMVPFSRQARAFARSTWSYWNPNETVPTHLGANVKDSNGAQIRESK